MAGVLRSLIRCRRASAATEFALIAPFFLALMVGLIEVSRYFWTVTTIQHAVNEAGRWAMVNTSATTTQIRDQALANLGNLAVAAADVVVTPQTAGGVDFVSITCCVNYEFTPMVVGDTLDMGNIGISVQSRVPLLP